MIKQATIVPKVFRYVLLVAMGLGFGWMESPQTVAFGGGVLRLKVTSPRVGLVFTDSETPDVRAAVTYTSGAPAEAAVTWSVQETEGSWKNSGQLSIAIQNGKGEKPLPLNLPGRGLYQLTVNAIVTADDEEALPCNTTVAVVFTPPAPDPASPWASFYIPQGGDFPGDASGAKANALSHRLLGAAWTRLNFWAWSYGTVTVTQVDGKPVVTADWSKWKEYAKELRAQGISIMGEIAQCPSALSSRKGDTSDPSGIMGPLEYRVKPRDYAEWDQLMEKLAADFKDEISVWEIWNEPDFGDGFWHGTPEEFSELIQHTSAALRKGNPNAKIAGCGFVGSQPFADRLFQLGMMDDIDILSVHYTDNAPESLAAWKALLTKYKLTIPIWNSEEKPEVPLLNMSQGIERSFKFLHTNIGYLDYGPLVEQDYTVRPSGVWFSVGAHSLGTAKFVSRSSQVPAYDTFFFQRGEEKIAAFRSQPSTSLFGESAKVSVTMSVEPLSAGQPVTLTDRFGRSRTLAIQDGRARATLDSSMLYVNGARTLEVLQAEVIQAPASYVIFEAEAGRLSSGWQVSGREGFSGGKIAEIYNNAEPGSGGHHVEIEMNLPVGGVFDVHFSGNTLTRLASPRSLSPFEWTVDGGPTHVVDKAITGLPNMPSFGEGLYPLGTVTLNRGRHTFRLKLTGRRDVPENYYALWFDAIVLHQVSSESGAQVDYSKMR